MTVQDMLRWVVLAGVFALPFVVLIVVNSFFFPFITGKNFAFRIIVEIMFSAWVVLALLDARYRPRWTALFVSVAAFIGVVGLATVFSENPFKSFWSNFERMEGYITLLHLFAYLVVAGTVMRAEGLWLWFWRISLTVSAVVSTHTLMQAFASESIRQHSTLGNPIYLAVYVMFHMFIALVLAARRGVSRGEQVAYLALIPLLATALFMTATRGATLGLVGGLILAGAGIAFSLRGHKSVRTAVAAVTLVFMLVIAGMWVARESAFVQGNQTLTRLTNISLSENTVFARTLVWGMAWQGVTERPLLGWGQEGYNHVFNKHYDPRMYGQEQWFDRTHNIIFDWLIAAGVLGLLAYLSIFLALLWTLYRTQRFTLIQKWLLFGALAAYGASNLTVFDNITSYILFFSIAAWVYAMADDVWRIDGSRERTPWQLARRFALPAAGAGAVLAIILVWSINMAPMRVAQDFIRALSVAQAAQMQAQQGNVEQAVEASQFSRTLFAEIDARGTFGTQEVREQWGTAASRLASVSALPEDERLAWYQESIAALTRQREEAPDDARFPFFEAGIHEVFGNVPAARMAFEEALARSPGKQSILMPLALATLRAGDAQQALAYAQEAFEGAPENDTARSFYAAVLLDTGNAQEALALIVEAPQLGTNLRVLRALVVHGRHADARRIWEGAYVRDGEREVPQERLFALTQAYVQTGDIARARAELVYIAEKHPELAAGLDAAHAELDRLQQQ